MAQLGRALRSGRRGRRFKSCRADYFKESGTEGERILGRGNLRGFDEASGVLFWPVYRLLFAEL